MKLSITSKRNSNLCRIQRALGLLGIVNLLVLLNGCASVPASEEPDPFTYNPNTDYPLVGGPAWGEL